MKQKFHKKCRICFFRPSDQPTEFKFLLYLNGQWGTIRKIPSWTFLNVDCNLKHEITLLSKTHDIDFIVLFNLLQNPVWLLDFFRQWILQNTSSYILSITKSNDLINFIISLVLQGNATVCKWQQENMPALLSNQSQLISVFSFRKKITEE